jgi:hypothetical protein
MLRSITLADDYSEDDIDAMANDILDSPAGKVNADISEDDERAHRPPRYPHSLCPLENPKCRWPLRRCHPPSNHLAPHSKRSPMSLRMSAKKNRPTISMKTKTRATKSGGRSGLIVLRDIRIHFARWRIQNVVGHCVDVILRGSEGRCRHLGREGAWSPQERASS